MFTMLAWLLLTGPVEPPEKLLRSEAVWQAVEKLAIREEVWDDYSGSVYGVGPESPPWRQRNRPVALACWRERYQQSVAEDWPYLRDTWQFAPCSAADLAAIAGYYESQAALAGRRLSLEYVSTFAAEQQVYLEHLQLQQRSWRVLSWAMDPECSFGLRRKSLHELRGLIGPTGFYLGKMPAP